MKIMATVLGRLLGVLVHNKIISMDEALYILEPLKKEKDGPQWTIEV